MMNEKHQGEEHENETEIEDDKVNCDLFNIFFLLSSYGSTQTKSTHFIIFLLQYVYPFVTI